MTVSAAFAPGNIVAARGRQWIVLPESGGDVLMLRPMGGVDDEIVGVCTALEEVRSANFSLPDPDKPGDFTSCRLLRDAARLSTRAAAGPFRSFAKIAVDPRPYQLVPLLMALRQEVVRLLIADDVGIGKTVEAALIAKELIERGEVSGLAVLCPPHLAEQWQRELERKFHISAELVLSSTVNRLLKNVQPGQPFFERYPFVVVSTDYIKSPLHRDEFIRSCPDLVIVDEAHTCTLAGGIGKSKQERFNLIQRIAADKKRHMILVTATPHSGNEAAFRSLLSLLDEKFADLPEDIEAESRSALREQLTRHLVQRLRGNVIEQDRKLGIDTQFPDRIDTEVGYKLTKEYRGLFDRVLDFVNELVGDDTGTHRVKRVRWWSALALLRAMASSPAAGAATLRQRAKPPEDRDGSAPADVADIDATGREAVFDETDDEAAEAFDRVGGADVYDDSGPASDRLKRLARDTEALRGKGDAKLKKLVEILKSLLEERSDRDPTAHSPIVFCRFIDTAEYVAEELRKSLKGVEVAAVTGRLPPEEREKRIEALAACPKRVLVCTDCLSEGVNLQEAFDAVIHYDLSWNPTRHDQREGRVSRFGQPSETVQVFTLFGIDTQIDGIILDVLLRRHKKIKSDLGIAVAVPGGSEDVVKALFEGMKLRAGGAEKNRLLFPEMEEHDRRLDEAWKEAAVREKKSRARFAQNAIKTEEVAAEWAAVREAIGAGPTVLRFFRDVLHLAGVPVVDKPAGVMQVPVDGSAPRSLRHAVGRDKPFLVRCELPVKDPVEYLSRTHPVVEGLASWVLDTALDDVQAAGERVIARRCGVAVTAAVSDVTTLLLARFRHHLHIVRKSENEMPTLAEEVVTLGFTGSADAPAWLDEAAVQSLLDANPSGNLPATIVKDQLADLLRHESTLRAALDGFAVKRAAAVAEAHHRVRKAADIKGRMVAEPVLPVDFLGCFILLPQDI